MRLKFQGTVDEFDDYLEIMRAILSATPDLRVTELIQQEDE